MAPPATTFRARRRAGQEAFTGKHVLICTLRFNLFHNAGNKNFYFMYV